MPYFTAVNHFHLHLQWRYFKKNGFGDDGNNITYDINIEKYSDL